MSITPVIRSLSYERVAGRIRVLIERYVPEVQLLPVRIGDKDFRSIRVPGCHMTREELWFDTLDEFEAHCKTLLPPPQETP